MQGNYRHHYRMSGATSAAGATVTPSPQASGAPATTQFSSAANSVAMPLPSKSISRQQQQQQYPHQQHGIQANHCNSSNGLPPMAANGNGIGAGLARMAQSKQILPGNYQLQFQKQQQQQVAEQNQASHVDRLINSQQRFNGRHFIDQQQQQQQRNQQLNRRDSAARLQYCTAEMPADLAGQNQRLRQQMQPSSRMNLNQNGGNPVLASQLREFFSHEDREHSDEEPPNDGHRQQHQRQTSQQLQDHYANQIRNSQLQQRFQQQQQQHQAGISCASYSGQQQQMMQRQALTAGPSGRTPAGGQYATSGAAMDQPGATGQSNGLRKERAHTGQRDVHVNFNRSNQANDDDDEGDSRKKKYLTAKYGQQQMNLIKKRLKIELWLYEHLQELAKGSGSEAELDEIDLDLDELLDMEDDDTRRRWLKKLLEPFEGLACEKVDKFIEEVLEQSKLL